LLAALVATALLVVAEAARGFAGLENARGDNDSLLRLVEVRDLLAGQGWFDLTQYRLGPDGGTVMHWSRLIDAPIAAIMWIVAALTGNMSAGETVAMVVWPLFCFAVALFFVVRAAEKLGGEMAVLPAAVVGGMCLYSVGIFTVGTLDHHNAQFALTMATISLLLDAEKMPRRALAAGMTSGLSIAIGMETALYVAATGFAVAILYLIQGERVARMVANYGVGFALTGLAVLVTTVAPSQWAAPACDAFSLVQFAVMSVGGAGLAVATSLPSLRSTVAGRGLGLGLIGLALATLMVVFFPQCVAAPYANVDPRLKFYLIDNIREAQPAWVTLQNDPIGALGLMATPFLGLAVLAVSLWRRGWRFDTMLVGICLLAATLIGLWQIRGGIFAACMATVPLAAWIATWRQDAKNAPWSTQLAMVAAWLLSINLTWGAIADVLLDTNDPAGQQTSAAEPDADTCAKASDYALLRAMPAATVLSGINQGAPILAFTQHRVVAAPYHRNLGTIVAYEAFAGDLSKAHQVLLDNGVSLVAVCRLVDESPDLPQNGLHARLMRGEAPAWLHMLPASKGQAIEVYTVAPAGT